MFITHLENAALAFFVSLSVFEWTLSPLASLAKSIEGLSDSKVDGYQLVFGLLRMTETNVAIM